MKTRRKLTLVISSILLTITGLIIWVFVRPGLETPQGLKKLTGYELQKGRNIVDFEFAPLLFDSDTMWVVRGPKAIEIAELEKLGYSKSESRSSGGDRDFIKRVIFSKRPNLSVEMADFSVWRGGTSGNHYLMISEDRLLTAHWVFEG